MIEINNLTKRYSDTVAVDDLSFTVPSGQVTGFLGPNGAGKSTTMRVIMGLDRATKGSATIDGRTYTDQRAPLRHVGALLEAKAVHPGRSAYAHLLALAQTHGLPRGRVDQVIDLVGLRSVAGRRAGGFSLGMGQRLGLAVALLGDPSTIILDEPVNGLDPDGVLWIRTLLRSLAEEGRTVLVSSHLMSEMALTAEHLIIVGRGRLLADTSVDELIATATNRPVAVTSPDAAALADLLPRLGATVTSLAPDRLDIHGIGADVIGDTAAQHGLRLHELHTTAASLEEVYLALTHDSREYRHRHHERLTVQHRRGPEGCGMTTNTNTNTGRPPASGTSSPSARRQVRPVADPDRGPTVGRLVLSEWTKLRSLRSSWWTLGLAALIGLGLAVAVAYTLGAGGDLGDDNVATVLASTGFAALVMGVLGALQMSGEYATGTISVSLTAVPRRWTLLAAKAAVLVAVVAPVSLAISAGTLLIGDAVIGGGVAFSWEAVLGNTAYLTAVALLALGLATVVRSTAMSITLLVAVVFVLPPLLPLLPWEWVETVADIFPGAAWESLISTVPGTSTMGDVTAVTTLVLWALVPLTAGAILLTRRDA